MKTKHTINLKTPEEIEILRQAGRILSSIRGEIKGSLKIGMTTQDIDDIAEKLIAKHQVKAAFKGYRGFPANVCTSVNEEVVHGIPNDKPLKEGDIVSVDIGIIYKHFYSDSAVTVPVGKVKPKIQALLDVTQQALAKGIEQMQVGNRLSNISHMVQSYAEKKGYGVVRDFVGHGIGRMLHEDPEIPNYGPPNQGPELKEGMVFAIEPMINLGTHRTRVLDDGWTVVTEDGLPSAHFEHCVALTDKGFEVLTL